MKLNNQYSQAPSLRILHSQDQQQKNSFQQYDQQPTILFLTSNRESLNNANYRPNIKNNLNNKRKAKLITCESNLMQSSPQKSDSSAVDGQFVCKYLTPIKKQQFHQLLFKDQVNQNIQHQKTKQHKQIKQLSKVVNQTEKIHQNQYMCNKQQGNIEHSNMIKSFQPCVSLNEITDKYLIQQKCYKNCHTQGNQSNIGSNPSIFIDPTAQIFFLKSNNNQLYKKLQKQIQINKMNEKLIQNLLIQNLKIKNQNLQKDTIINNLKQKIIKYEEQRKKYLAKQWQQFQFVKQILIQKKNNKNKKVVQRSNENSKNKDINQNSILKQARSISQNMSKQIMNPKFQQKQFQTQKQQIYSRSISSGKISPSIVVNTICSQNDKKIHTEKKKRKLSYENLTQAKKYSNKNIDKVEKILQHKLIMSENQYKRSQRSSPLRKTHKKNGLISKQHINIIDQKQRIR